MEKEPKNYKPLNPQQKKFCELYVSQEFFANAIESYRKAYKLPIRTKRAVLSCAAARLLTRPDICAYINSQLDAAGLNDEFVDKQLLHLLTQHADFSVKIKAIAEYNKLKARIKDPEVRPASVNVYITDFSQADSGKSVKSISVTKALPDLSDEKNKKGV